MKTLVNHLCVCVSRERHRRMFEIRFVVGFLCSLIFESGFCLDGKQQNVSDFTNRRSVVFQSGGGTRKCSLKYGGIV